MSTPPRLGVVAAAILSVGAGGCSFLFVNGPPANHKTSNFFGCTSSNTIPFVDLAFAAGSVLEAVEAGAGTQTYGTTTGTQAGAAVSYGAAAALLAASAAYGFNKTSQCRDALADLVKRAPPPTLAPALAPPIHYDPWVAHPAQTPPGGLPDVPPAGAAALPPATTPTPSPAAPPAAPPSPWETPRPAQ